MRNARAGRRIVGAGTCRRAAGAALAGALLSAAWLAPAASGVAPGANGRIAYHQYSSGTSERWVQHFDPLHDGPHVPVSHGYSTGGTVMADDLDPSWSPDGRLVLSGDPDGNQVTGDDLGPDLIVTDALGLVRTNITRTPSVSEYTPAWSPDGGSIAYAVGSSDGGDIWIRSPDGTAPRAVGPGAEPAWSPDGSRLAFTRGGDIFTMGRDGTGLRRVTDDPRDDRMPSWAPDGARIAWTRQEAVMGRNAISEVWIARTDGTGAHRLTADPVAAWAPAFSPDGTLLAYSRHQENTCCPTLWVLDLRTGDERFVGGMDAADWERLNRPPEASLRATQAGAGRIVRLVSTSSDPDGPLTAQAWDLDGDGQYDDATGDRARLHVAKGRRSVTVGLRVTDADGVSASSSETIAIRRGP